MNVGTHCVSSRRLEDPRLITGQGTYVSDLLPEGTLHCAFIRSSVAHGTITDIDLDDARQADGVVAVFTAADLDLREIPSQTGRGPICEPMTRPPLATQRVRYVGEPVAVVVANSARQAADAVDLAWVDIDELPAEVSMGDNRSLLFDGTSNNVVAEVHIEHGEPAPPPEVTASVSITHQRLAPTSLETQAFLAVPNDSGLHVWCSHQAPHRLKGQITNLLGISPVRVVVPDVGGAFGMKGALYPEYLVTAAVAHRLQRAAAWIQRRPEQFTGGTHGRGQRHDLTLEGTADGRITRAVFDLWSDAGAYPHNGSAVPMFGRLVATGMYDIARVEINATTVVTNQAPTGPYRGAGRPEAALTIERGIDAFARAARLNPVDVRLKNVITQHPYVTASGSIYDSGDYGAAVSLAASKFDREAIAEQQSARLSDGKALLGLGFGAFVERAGGAVESWEYARVEVDSDTEEIVVRTGSTDGGGQSHKTVWSQIAARHFGVDSIRVIAGDTDEVAAGIGTFASRSAQLGASAVHNMSLKVIETAKLRAASALEAAVDDIRYAEGVFSVAGTPDIGVSLWQLAESEPLAEEEKFQPNAQTFPYGVHAALVEVLVDTGEVRILDAVAVDDCGRVLSPMIVEGQLHGSMAQGLGQALWEEVIYDEDGQPLTTSLLSYLVPDSMALPPVRADRLEHPAPSNPLGVKGSGEAGCIGFPPAIVNATLDALSPLGVTDLQLPLRPQKVWEAIQEAQHRV